MKVTISDENREVIVIDKAEIVDVYEALDIYLDAMFAYGYHPNSVTNAILEKAEEYKPELPEE